MENVRKLLVRMGRLELPRPCERWNLNAIWGHRPALKSFFYRHFRRYTHGEALVKVWPIIRTTYGFAKQQTSLENALNIPEALNTKTLGRSSCLEITLALSAARLQLAAKRTHL